MRKIAFGFAAAAALAASPAFAGTATNNMPVSVNVINSCTVSASALDFGSVTVIGGTAIDSSASVGLTCTNGANYDVALDLGTHSLTGQRYLANAAGTVTVPYNVYRDAGRTQAWGSASGSTVTGTAGSTGVVALTAYGRIPATASSVVAGAYTDTVTVTVTF